MRKLLLMAALMFGFALPGVAAMSPDAIVKETSDKLLAALAENRDRVVSDKAYLYNLVGDIVLPRFDFESMSRLALGRYWNVATQAQRDEFVSEFRTLLVNTYAVALTHYNNQTVRFLPLQAEDDARRVTVKTEINQPGGVPIPIFYKLLNREADDWKVYDVIVDGVSLVTNYRSAFAQDMRQGGVDVVIENLKQRNVQYQIADTQDAASAKSEGAASKSEAKAAQ
ncbi:MAG: ABC transporter substrate-binding protein [Gammaproteobacteria bacterium]|nr:ABC transporter substrate-binding protein [Gammaproteobacteria bacterium]